MPMAVIRTTRDLVFYLIDADNFKEVNDQYGHDVGDRVLVEMARRLSSSIRHSDVLVRWGGEEFLIVSRYTNRSEAEWLAQRVLSAVADTPSSEWDGSGETEQVFTAPVRWAGRHSLGPPIIRAPIATRKCSRWPIAGCIRPSARKESRGRHCACCRKTPGHHDRRAALRGPAC